MRIVYHLGAHCTDEDRLVRCLLKNRAVLADQGIAVPAPTRYRKLLRDTSIELKGASATAEAQAATLGQIVGEQPAARVVLSWDSFLGFPTWAARDGLYSYSGERALSFTQIFPYLEAEFHLAIRNPATFLPALQQKVLTRSTEDILTGLDPRGLLWSDTIRRILHHCPNVPLTVWCDEDTPLIWNEVVAAVSGHAPGTALTDTDELMSILLTPEGFTRMRAYVAAHPPSSVAQRRRVVTAFLERFAQTDQITVDVDAPGWTQDLVDELTARYHADVAMIRAMPGVHFLSA